MWNVEKIISGWRRKGCVEVRRCHVKLEESEIEVRRCTIESWGYRVGVKERVRGAIEGMS